MTLEVPIQLISAGVTIGAALIAGVLTYAGLVLAKEQKPLALPIAASEN